MDDGHGAPSVHLEKVREHHFAQERVGKNEGEEAWSPFIPKMQKHILY
jgi:hypothetical protein